MDKTKIDWADATWNPVTGCLHGCEYCYARRIAERFGEHEYQKPGHKLIHELEFPTAIVGDLDKPAKITPYPYNFEPTFHRYRLDIPAHWKKPRNIFVCSMADLFGEWVPDAWIQEVFKACEEAPQHRYLFLTKNPKRYESYIGDRHVPGNMWFGWSQTEPLGKGAVFTSTHSMNTFVSIEPLLASFTETCIRGIGWVIVGAETGNRKGKVVPKKDWVDFISASCAEAGIPIFMKESLRDLMGDDFRQEFPWETQAVKPDGEAKS